MPRTGVHLVVVAALLLGCSRSAPLVSRPSSSTRSLVLRNVRVFDAPRGALLDGLRDVLIRDGRIAAVGATGLPAEGVSELDGKGGTLLPGLVDVHAHTGSTAEPPGRFTIPDVEANLAAFLYAGVTTVLDLGSLSPDVFRERDRIADGATLGPHIYAAGPMFTAPGGHPVEMLRPNLPWFLRWYVIPRVTREVDTPAAATAAVTALLPERPDILKIMLDAGLGDVPRLTPETFAAITAAGHAAGVRSITHVTSAADAVVAVQHGTDALAHSPALDALSDEQAAIIAAAHVPVVVTLAISDLIEGQPRAAADVLAIEREVAGPELLARLLAPPAQPTALQRAIAAAHDLRRANVATLRRAGVTILAGSDACNPGDLAGGGLHLELTKMVEAGLSPGEALRAATFENARFLAGAAAEFGVIAPGKRADLVLVAGDPVARIDDLGRISAVILDGTVLTRAQR